MCIEVDQATFRIYKEPFGPIEIHESFEDGANAARHANANEFACHLYFRRRYQSRGTVGGAEVRYEDKRTYTVSEHVHLQTERHCPARPRVTSDFGRPNGPNRRGGLSAAAKP
jgi:hypothetical protein